MSEEKKRPYTGHICPKDERIACKDCSWFIKAEWSCKLGYIREYVEPRILPGEKKEPKSRW